MNAKFFSKLFVGYREQILNELEAFILNNGIMLINGYILIVYLNYGLLSQI